MPVGDGLPGRHNSPGKNSAPGKESTLEEHEIVMAFDFGTSSIGVAVGQRLTKTATPVATVKAKDGKPDWSPLDRLIAEWNPGLLIVGIPLHMDGSESEMSRRARKFSNRLHGRFHLPCVAVDERLSSFAAKHLENPGRRAKHSTNISKRDIDSISAKLILESWLWSTPPPQ